MIQFADKQVQTKCSSDADAMAQAEAMVQQHIAAHPELMAIDPKERQAAHT